MLRARLFLIVCLIWSALVVAAGSWWIASTVSALGQEPPPRHDKYASDPHAFCRKGPNDPEAPSEHACTCSLMCSEPTDTTSGAQMENISCELWCTRARCLCYPDDPCKAPPVI